MDQDNSHWNTLICVKSPRRQRLGKLYRNYFPLESVLLRPPHPTPVIHDRVVHKTMYLTICTIVYC